MITINKDKIISESFLNLQPVKYNTPKGCPSPYGIEDKIENKTKWEYKKKSDIHRATTLNENKWEKKGIIIVPSELKEQYDLAKNRIVELCKNTDDESEPNADAQKLAIKVLDKLIENNILPSLINSSGDKSLLFDFFIDEKYYLIEIYNSGEIIYLRRIEGERKHIEELNIARIDKIIKEINRAYTDNTKLR